MYFALAHCKKIAVENPIGIMSNCYRKNITVKLYRPRNGLKEIPCVLTGYEDGKLTVTAGKETITFEKSEVALVRLRVEF